MKVQIIGPCGAGKSALSHILGQKMSLEPLCLDNIALSAAPGPQLQAYLDTHGAWVLDGLYPWHDNYRSLDEADAIILLYPAGAVRMVRIRRRIARYRGTSRPSRTDGHVEKMSAKAAFRIFLRDRLPQHTRLYRTVRKKYGAKCTLLRTSRQVRKYLKDTWDISDPDFSYC